MELSASTSETTIQEPIDNRMELSVQMSNDSSIRKSRPPMLGTIHSSGSRIALQIGIGEEEQLTNRYAFWTFVVLGVAALGPLNAFLTPGIYFIKTYHEYMYGVLVWIVSIPSLVIFPLMIRYGRFVPYRMMLYVWFPVNCILLLLVPLCAEFFILEKTVSEYAIYALAFAILCGAELAQSSLYALAAILGSDYIQAINTGVSLSGVIYPALNVALAVGFPLHPPSSKSTYILTYFVFSVLPLIIALAMFRTLTKTHFYKSKRSEFAQALMSGLIKTTDIKQDIVLTLTAKNQGPSPAESNEISMSVCSVGKPKTDQRKPSEQTQKTPAEQIHEESVEQTPAKPTEPEERSEVSKGKNYADQEHDSSDKEPFSKLLKSTLSKMWKMALLCWFILFISFVTYPVLLFSIDVSETLGECGGNVLYLFYVVFLVLGTFLITLKSKAFIIFNIPTIWKPCLLRSLLCIFPVLVFLAQRGHISISYLEDQSESVTVLLCLTYALVGLTEGHNLNLVMTYAPELVDTNEVDIASMIMIFMLTLGVFAGTCFSLIYTVLW